MRWKGSGQQEACRNSWGILVSATSGKHFHTWIRSHTAFHFETIARETQCGSRSGKGTDLCSHLVKQFWSWTVFACLSAGLTFVDVVGAFDAVIRKLLFDTEILDESVAMALRALGFGPEVMHSLFLYVRSVSLLQDADADPHLCALLKEAHQDKWFTTQGVVPIARTVVGCRPGDPLGVVIFNDLATFVLEELEKEASSRGLVALLLTGPSDCVMNPMEICSLVTQALLMTVPSLLLINALPPWLARWRLSPQLLLTYLQNEACLSNSKRIRLKQCWRCVVEALSEPGRS